MMKTIASKLQRKRVALVVVLGMAVMVFASVVDKSTGDLPWQEEHGRRSLAAYFGSWDMLQSDIKDVNSKRNTYSALRKETSERLKTVTEEFRIAAMRVRNENIESGLEVSQQYEDEVESIRLKFNQDEEHTSDLLHELYDDKKRFDTLFDADKEVHDYKRETVVGEIEGRLNESHELFNYADTKLKAEQKKYDEMSKLKKKGRKVVEVAYRKEKLRRYAAKAPERRAARAKARQAARLAKA